MKKVFVKKYIDFFLGGGQMTTNGLNKMRFNAFYFLLSTMKFNMKYLE